MSPDDTDSDDSEHSNGESTVEGGGRESQPRDPETGQFLSKDERGGAVDTESDETGSGDRGPETAGARPDDDRETATRRRGQRPREPPEQHRQQASSMRLYTLPPTHPLVRSTAGPTASETAGGRDLPPALDLVALQVQRDGRPVLRDAAAAANQSGPGQPVPNPRTRPPTEAVAQTPPTGGESHRSPGTESQRSPGGGPLRSSETGPQRSPPAEFQRVPPANPQRSSPPEPRRSQGAESRHPSTGGAESTPTAMARSDPTPSTDVGPDAGSGRGRWPGRGGRW